MNDTDQSRTHEPDGEVGVNVATPNLLLPVVLWSQIFCFLGNAPDLIHCEQTCRELYQVIHNNDNAIFWKDCPGATDDYDARYQSMSYRQRACIHYVSDLIRKEQNKTDNIIESCLGIPLWLALVHSALHRTLPNDYVTFHVRGDASFVLMEMLQDSLIERFRQAYGTTIKQKKSSQENLEYPILTADALVAKEDPDPSHPCPDAYFNYAYGYNVYEGFLQSIMSPSTPNTNLLLPTEQAKEMAALIMTEFPELTMTRCIEKMIRRISWRAGVVKLSPDFYSLAWESTLQTILVILVSACNRTFILQELRGGFLNQKYCPFGSLPRAALIVSDHGGRRVQQKMPLLPRESIRDVPPFPYFPRRPKVCRNPPPQGHFLVPRQLEEAALNLPTLPKRVYGAGWHVSRGSTLEKEIMLAEAMYTFEDEQEDDEEAEWDKDNEDVEEDDDEEDYEWDKDDSDDSDGAEDGEEDAEEGDEEDTEGNHDDLDSDVDDENNTEGNDDDLDADDDDDDTEDNDDLSLPS